MFNVENLFFKYKNKDVFKDLTLKISDKITFITGKNGSGKSTLLKLLVKIEKYSKGKIYFNDKEIKKIKMYKLGKKCGYLFQNPDDMLFANTVEDELYFLNSLYNKKVDIDFKQKTAKYVENFNLSDHLDKFPLQLSSGQKQKLALITLFQRDLDYLILDEPTSFLDNDSKMYLIEILKEKVEKGCKLIIATHDEMLINSFSQKKIVELYGVNYEV